MAFLLKRGMRDRKVIQIQELLNDALMLSGSACLPGIEKYGPKTEEAVKRFQREIGLHPSGIVDGPTMELLEEYAAHPRTCHETEWDWPLVSNKIRRGLVNHTFGMVRRYADGRRKPHQGWDFEALTGTDTFAVADGTIVFVKDHGDYGKQVCMHFSHLGMPRYAFYAHLDSWVVRTGQDVRMGELIGQTGESGNARGMPKRDQHLHFEIRLKAMTGRGLAGRESPLKIFRVCPLHKAEPKRIQACVASAESFG